MCCILPKLPVIPAVFGHGVSITCVLPWSGTCGWNCIGGVDELTRGCQQPWPALGSLLPWNVLEFSELTLAIVGGTRRGKGSKVGGFLYFAECTLVVLWRRYTNLYFPYHALFTWFDSFVGRIHSAGCGWVHFDGGGEGMLCYWTLGKSMLLESDSEVPSPVIRDVTAVKWGLTAVRIRLTGVKVIWLLRVCCSCLSCMGDFNARGCCFSAICLTYSLEVEKKYSKALV